jgi:hypothetical protein
VDLGERGVRLMEGRVDRQRLVEPLARELGVLRVPGRGAGVEQQARGLGRAILGGERLERGGLLGASEAIGAS